MRLAGHRQPDDWSNDRFRIRRIMHATSSDNSLEQLLKRLPIPPQNQEKLSFGNANAAAAKAWINQLPQTNPPEVCKRLYTLLPEIPSLRVAPSRKLAILDAFRPTVFTAVDKLTANISLNETNTRAIALGQALLKYLGSGYLSVAVACIRNTDQDDAGDIQSNTLANSIYHTLAVKNRILIDCWQCYIAPPANFWLELHSLYRLARHFKLEAHPLSVADRDSNEKSMDNRPITPGSAYLKTLLLSCANPGHYTPAELKKISAFLNTWAGLAKLAPAHEQGLFVVDTESNTGPVYASRMKQLTRHHLRLRTDGLVAFLENKLPANPTQSFIALPNRILRNLCAYWQEERMRTTERKPDGKAVVAVLGLAAVHRLISKTANLDEFLLQIDRQRPTSQLSNHRPGFERQKQASGDIWQNAPDALLRREIRRETAQNADGSIPYYSIEQEKTQKKAVRGYAAVRLNTSDQGACIEFQSAPTQLSPGELVGLKIKDTGEWLPGVVRWIHITPKLYRLAGIEFIGANMEPCAACVLKSGRPATPYLPGLLSVQHNQLIVPSMPFKEGNRVRFSSLRGEEDKILGEPLNATFHLSWFTLRE